MYGRPYSLYLRERVVAAVESGRSHRDVASSFGVAVSSVVKWSQCYRATGSAAALPMGGRRGRGAGEQLRCDDRVSPSRISLVCS